MAQFDTTIVSTEITISDVNKGSPVCRPHSGFKAWWSTASTESWVMPIWNALLAFQKEGATTDAAKARWEAHIAGLMALTGGDRAAAIRWSVATQDVHGNVDDYCHEWNLNPGVSPEIRAALSAA